MAVDNDPRPVLRQELAKVFKNQRVVRAFEKLFDLIPPEFINQQIQIDTLDLASAIMESQTQQALDGLERLASAVDRVAVAPASIDIEPWQDLVPPPVQTQGATPTASIGLVTVAGVAETFMRSDAASAIDQSIAPTWTSSHKFTKAVSAITDSPVFISTAIPYLSWDATGDGANARFWSARVNALHWQLQTFNDSSGANRSAIDISRGAGATNIVDISLGNATDNPTYNFLGTSTPTHGSTTLLKTSVALANGAGASLGTLTNAPSAGNPTKWITVNDNGTLRQVPSW